MDSDSEDKGRGCLELILFLFILYLVAEFAPWLFPTV